MTVEWRLEGFVIAAKSNQDYKFLIYYPLAGTKKHGYGVYIMGFLIYKHFDIDFPVGKWLRCTQK